MPPDVRPLPEVYSAREIARAAGVSVRSVQALVRSGELPSIDRRFLAQADAVRAVRWLTGHASKGERPVFAPALVPEQRRGAAAMSSAGVHLALCALLLLVSMPGGKTAKAARIEADPSMRLVFLVTPGPGGGGGGGGLREKPPPPPAQRKGTAHLRSPVAVRRPPPPAAPRMTVPPPPVRVEPPPVVAPVVPVAADTQDRAGLPAAVPPQPADSHGPGSGGGSGTGAGAGLGSGDGSGIGPGSGGGTGGGPYRPGSGITPPVIVQEVKPDYTEEGRRRNLEGDVVMEIVVRRDGTVGDVRLLQGLGAGLDQRAIDAVRQWRFSPAQRLGAAVDVIVEVAMEFKLR